MEREKGAGAAHRRGLLFDDAGLKEETVDYRASHAALLRRS